LRNENSGKLQRIWGKHSVDVNLRDEWLELLNQMRILELCAICEGHIARIDPISRNAEVIARIREHYQLFFHQHWDELLQPVSDLLWTCFDRKDARINFSATREISLWPEHKYSPATSDRIFLHATKRHARKKLEFDEETGIWFENTVTAFMLIDAALYAHYLRLGGTPESKHKKRR